jgi:hypothetical protein
MNIGWHVTAQDITQWTETNQRRAQEILPLLVKKLINASVFPSLLHFPTGDSVQMGGWDGILTSNDENQYVPKGDSVWEFGTNKNIHQKAESDFHKRTNDPSGIDKLSTTYVFVTTRTWAKCRDWEREKNNEQQWAKVKGLNADDLASWLELCPAVHRWFASVIGKRPEGVWDIEQAWKSWSYATQPPCSTDLLLAGRLNQVDLLVKKLLGSPSVIRVSGESEEEAYAFVLASLIKDEGISARVLVVKDAKIWDSIIESKNSLILIPRFSDTRNFGFAIKQGHFVILPLSTQLISTKQVDIVLRKVQREQQLKALIEMGLDGHIAEPVIKSTRGYLLPIRRHQSLAPLDYKRPEWANSEHSMIILTVLFTGAWKVDNLNDCQIIEELANMKYEEIDRCLNKLRKNDDPPVRLVDNVWQIVSRQDTWALMSTFIDGSFLDRFFAIVKKVLGENDPRLELPPEERWMANIRGKVTKYSGLLARGIAEMLAMLASYGDTDCHEVGITSIQQRVSHIVKIVLTEEMSGKRWGSLRSNLPYLAEAAPDTFLEVLESDLKKGQPSILELFVEEGFWGGCPHAGLLWALECISWNLELLSRVTRILGKLHLLDPGGTYSNRPLKSLKEIFQGWFPQTKATLPQRISIIETLLRFEPQAGWQLLLTLLPKRGGDSSGHIYRPKFREWADGWERDVTKDEYTQFIIAIGKMLIKSASVDIPSRWIQAIEHLPQLPKECFDLALVELKNIGLENFTEIDRSLICNELREIISKHRRFYDSDWALPKEAVDQLYEVYSRFLPNDKLIKNKFLFEEYSPPMINPAVKGVYEENQELIRNERNQALKEIWEEKREEGIQSLAEGINQPWILGESLGRSDISLCVEQLVLNWLGSDNSLLDHVAKVYVRVRYYNDTEWLKAIQNKYITDWQVKKSLSFCLGLPFCQETFKLLESLPSDVNNLYWENTVDYLQLPSNEYESANWVLEQLLNHMRSFAAIDAGAHYLHFIKRDGRIQLNKELIMRALEQAAIKPSGLDVNFKKNIRYEIQVLIEYLQSFEDIDEARLAQIEWVYVQIFKHSKIKPITLIKELFNNPSFFVQLICYMYRSNPPIEGEFSDIEPEQLKLMAENADCLLDMVDNIPGEQTGEIDVDHLHHWVDKAREEVRKKNRSAIGDQTIGKLLSYSPVGNDGVWPHEAIRDLIEKYESKDLDLGIHIGLMNQRGVTSRDVREGGEQERRLEAYYRQQAEKIQYSWPRTSALLRRIADDFSRQAKMEDLEVELRDS